MHTIHNIQTDFLYAIWSIFLSVNSMLTSSTRTAFHAMMRCDTMPCPSPCFPSPASADVIGLEFGMKLWFEHLECFVNIHQFCIFFLVILHSTPCWESTAGSDLLRSSHRPHFRFLFRRMHSWLWRSTVEWNSHCLPVSYKNKHLHTFKNMPRRGTKWGK